MTSLVYSPDSKLDWTSFHVTMRYFYFLLHVHCPFIASVHFLLANFLTTNIKSIFSTKIYMWDNIRGIIMFYVTNIFWVLLIL